LFGLLREKHGEDEFQQLVEEKAFPLAGDVIYQNLGMEAPLLDDLTKDIEVIVNIAATTNFYERQSIVLTLLMIYCTQYERTCKHIKFNCKSA
jgi:alcohol-forming fatty acyl-CoA reductase